MLQPPNDEQYMKMALAEAERAYDLEEVPVGAIVVCQNKVIARAHNLTEQLHDFTAHAEMQAFTAATEYLGGKHLDECTLYVTLEPCLMCAGACYNTRIGKIVFGAPDHKRGFSKFDSKDGKCGVIHPKTKVVQGILQEECSSLLSNFFEAKRKN